MELNAWQDCARYPHMARRNFRISKIHKPALKQNRLLFGRMPLIAQFKLLVDVFQGVVK